MNRLKNFLKNHKEYDIYLVDKKFGNGKQLIQFFYRRQVDMFKQGFLAYVDNQKWLIDKHAVMDEVENYLIENNGVIKDDNYEEDFDKKPDHKSEDYKNWVKEQFPAICLLEDGVCYFDKA